MKAFLVNIDFNIMRKAVKEDVRKKAISSGLSIVYLKNGQLIEENPRTHAVKVLRKTYAP